jgi:hypothetical protein
MVVSETAFRSGPFKVIFNSKKLLNVIAKLVVVLGILVCMMFWYFFREVDSLYF